MEYTLEINMIRKVYAARQQARLKSRLSQIAFSIASLINSRAPIEEINELEELYCELLRKYQNTIML